MTTVKRRVRRARPHRRRRPTGERLPFEFDIEAGPHGTGEKAVKGLVELSGMSDDDALIVLHKLQACAEAIYESLSGQKAPPRIPVS